MINQDGPPERSAELGEELTEERFVKDLYLFMKQRDTPIERIPHLGFKQIDLFLMYKTVKELGGYQQVTTQQLWKKVYNILGGNPRSTSAATCTRRHYEKLLLAYECHQNGYRDDIVFRTPRAQKRFQPSSYDFEHEFTRNGKRPDFRHLPPFPQASANIFTEHQRPIFSMPLNVSSYFPHGSASLPNYIALREPTLPHLSINSSQDHSRTHASYLGMSSVEIQSCKQPLDKLRHLAKEYKSSAGLEEPLNLSRRENRLETLSDTPSSFGPPSSKKPKFLNEASPLYPPRGVTSEEATEQGEKVDEASLEEGGVRSSPMMTDVIDLTSNANPVPRRPSPPSVNLFNRKPNYSEAYLMKARERDLYADSLKEESSAAKPKSNAIEHPTPDPNGNMEIQIPLKLLQELIRRGMISNPVFTGNGTAIQDQSKAEEQAEQKLHMRSRSEASESSSSEEPANLCLKSPFGKPADHVPQENVVKKYQLLGGNRIPAESKLQMMSSFHVNSSLKLSLDRETSRPSQPKQDQDPFMKNLESLIPRRPNYIEDGPLSLTMKPQRNSEKVMTTPTIAAKDSTSPPLIQVTSDHLRFLLANLPYRLERGQTF